MDDTIESGGEILDLAGVFDLARIPPKKYVLEYYHSAFGALKYTHWPQEKY